MAAELLLSVRGEADVSIELSGGALDELREWEPDCCRAFGARANPSVEFFRGVAERVNSTQTELLLSMDTELFRSVHLAS